MNIHEYQAKQVFAEYGVPIPPGQMIEKAADARAAAQGIGGNICDTVVILVSAGA